MLTSNSRKHDKRSSHYYVGTKKRSSNRIWRVFHTITAMMVSLYWPPFNILSASDPTSSSTKKSDAKQGYQIRRHANAGWAGEHAGRPRSSRQCCVIGENGVPNAQMSPSLHSERSWILCLLFAGVGIQEKGYEWGSCGERKGIWSLWTSVPLSL